MRKLFIPLLAAVALPTAINAIKVNCNSNFLKNKPKFKANIFLETLFS